MAIDWDAIMQTPIYSLLGVSAIFTPSGAGEPVTVTIIDKTAGVEVGSDINTLTIRPGATVRAADLAAAGYGRESLDDGYLEFSGAIWRIEAYMPRPSPVGQASGEFLLLLSEHYVEPAE